CRASGRSSRGRSRPGCHRCEPGWFDSCKVLHEGIFAGLHFAPMHASFILTLAFGTALFASLIVKFWLATRQMRHVTAHRDVVPAAFAHTITLPAHQRAADYTLAKGRFGL